MPRAVSAVPAVLTSVLDGLTNLLATPPAVLAAGFAVAGFIWAFFEKVEDILPGKTIAEISDWLLGVSLGETLRTWPGTFAKLFDRVFGERHLSWHCFLRSCLATLAAVTLTLAVLSMISRDIAADVWNAKLFLLCAVGNNLLFDYISLLKTRWFIRRLEATSAALPMAGILLCDALLGLAVAYAATRAALLINWTGHIAVAERGGNPFGPGADFFLAIDMLAVTFVAATFGSVWLWLYAAAGFALKAARRFDVGFRWYNSKVDIEHKPLRAVGLVAGTLVAMLYWAAVAVACFAGPRVAGA